MSAWPGNPVASMDVSSFHGGTSCEIDIYDAQLQQTVTDTHIDFVINIAFHDHPWFDNGRGYFSAQLEKFTPNGWEVLGFQAKSLGNNNDDGDWYDTLTVSTVMTDQIEQYRILLHCETRDTTLGTSEDDTATLAAIQGQSAIGSFTLDFVPLSIVYCPPGQDMTGTLTQSESYGTRFTLGESSGMESQSGAQAKVDFLGLFGEGVGLSQSQSITNQSTSGIQVSHFRTTVITADNQKAIGRAYWGPLGDMFVILVNPAFAVSRRADGTLLYSMTQIEQVLAVPAWKLLRPGEDPIANAIPANVRQQLLQLDPFITGLQLFFPDSGADLGQAANPYTDPTANNRAEMIGRWWLDTGTELNYALGETHQLFSTDATEVKYSSTVSINANAGVDFDDISLGLSVSSSNTTTVGFQSSQETDESESTTASCFLIHNQNERDLDGIEIYYDKIFSTFMYRRVLARSRKGQCGGALLGSVMDVVGAPLKRLAVQLTGTDKQVHATTTSIKGEFAFLNICPGQYTLSAGDHTAQVTISEGHSPFSPARLGLKGVRRVLDLNNAPIWEVREALGLPSETVQRLAGTLKGIHNVRSLAKAAGVGSATLASWTKSVAFTWPAAAAQPPSKP
jgi:hypothetical protein